MAKQILKNWPDGLIGLDHYGKIIFCNGKTKEILGWEIDDLVGSSAHELLCSKAADYAHQAFECPMCQELLDDEAKLDHFEAWWVGANGVYLNLDVRVLQPEVSDLEVSKILMFSECSSGMVSQYEARRLAMFAEFSPVPILEIESPGSIEFANPAMTDLMVEYGFNDEGIPNILPSSLEAIVESVVNSSQTLVHQEVEFEDRAFIWSFNSLVKNQKNVVQVYGMDVTELRELQNKLEEARDIAERASEAKSHFLANMSHEIRTPMNAIVGFTEILLRSQLDEKQKGYCNKIKISSSVLLDVINDILDFSKIEAGKLTLESAAFNFVECVEVLADLFADRANDAGVELIFDIDQSLPAMVVGDSLRLKQVMINLVSNALKFTKQGFIEVVVRTVRSGDGSCRVRVEVRDTGKGIAKDQQAKLFAPFTQEDESTTRKFGGTGLGLSICRSLVELMEGSIGVRSKEGQGSVFFFEANFGVADSTSVLESQMRHHQAPKACTTVLLLESNGVLRRSLRQQLSAYGIDVQEFEGGMALVDEEEWVEKRHSLLAVFVDAAPDNIAWVESFAQKLGPTGYHPALMELVSLSTKPPWGSDFCWPSDRTFSCERPIKPSIVSRTILSKVTDDVGGALTPQRIQANEPLNLEGYHVLVVDDNAFNRELALELLEPTRAILDAADDGAVAMSKASKKSYDIILMDIQMPRMDGFEAARLLKDKDPNQVIIAVTANAIKGDRERFASAGFDDYLSKPLDVKRLNDIMLFWVSKLRSETQAVARTSFQSLSSGAIAAPSAMQSPMSETSEQSEETQGAQSDVPDDTKMPQEYRGLQVQRALKMVGEKKSLYFKLMKLFTDNYKSTANDLLKALQENDIMTAGRIVHTIKGSASNLGAENLRVIAMQLEQSIDEDARAMQDHLTQFCAQLDETLAVMDEFIDRYRHLGAVNTKNNEGSGQL